MPLQIVEKDVAKVEEEVVAKLQIHPTQVRFNVRSVGKTKS
jgi:hypothetical protein